MNAIAAGPDPSRFSHGKLDSLKPYQMELSSVVISLPQALLMNDPKTIVNFPLGHVCRDGAI